MKNKKRLLIISHTEHYLSDDGKIYGLSSTVREINHLSRIFKNVIHLAPLHTGKIPKLSEPYSSNNIDFRPLKPSGGKGLIKKISILYWMPFNLYYIHQLCKSADWIQFRSPTNLGIYVLPYLSFISVKKKWVKYAGDWQKKKIPLSFKIQREWLKNNFQNSIVTINGKWENQKGNILNLDNPCLEREEILSASIILKKKKYSGKLNICFVGRIEFEKGPHLLIMALSKMIEINQIETTYIVGEGKNFSEIEKHSENSKSQIIFTGSLNRYELNNIYAKCHLIILPSVSEGFPKVITEASAFGCIPVVSGVGSIPQYINDNNGLILKRIEPVYIAKKIDGFLKNRANLNIIAINAHKFSKRFTYLNYNYQIQNLIKSYD